MKNSDAIILGIESSCDETAASVVKGGREILSNVVSTQVYEHEKFGGVVPEIASRRHIEEISNVVIRAIRTAKVNFDDLDAIAVTYTPGLVGSLLVGVNFAKGLSLMTGLPLVPVHHLRAHVASNYISNKSLEPPFLCLIVSGGHSHIVDVSGYTEYKIVGKTRDDAAGEVFDKVARCIGLPYPGGVHLDQIAEYGQDDVFKFPVPKIKDSIYDYSFSGLKSCAINLIHKFENENKILNKNDLSSSFRKSVVNYLLSNFLLAAKNFERNKLVISGGVSANKLLRKCIEKESRKLNLEFFIPEISLCGDNAAMVAAQGYYEYLNKNFAKSNLNAFSRSSIE